MPTLQQVKSFLVAITSGRDKKLQAARDAICDVCPEYVEQPTKTILGKWKMKGFCKACGCGARSLADIRAGKNALRKTKCPLGKWPGDAESMGLTLKEVNALFGARDRLEYNMAIVQNNIDKQKPLDAAVQASIFGHPQAGMPQKGPMPPGKAPAGAGAVAVARLPSPQAVPAKKFAKAFPPKQLPTTQHTSVTAQPDG